MREGLGTGPRAWVRGLANALLVVCALGTSVFLAWEALSAAAFAYPVLYERAGIDENIALYGPRNRYKRAFETTTRAERIRLFADLVRAVNHGGEGLAQIRYHDPQGRALDTLLRPAEIVHLRDVAGLISALKRSGYLGMALFGVIALAHWRWRIPPPKAGHAFLTLALLFAAVGVGSYLYGPERLFYQWHTLVFPLGHQWFFYYEDSLMTTLMKAPDLFAYIAALLAATTLGIFTALLVALRWLLGRDEREP